MQNLLNQAVTQWSSLLPHVSALGPNLEKLGEAMLRCWEKRGKVLIAGNGGSAADAIHFAEELVVRFHKNRRGLAAIALCDSGVITCAGNDLGFDQVFSRQVQALGNPGDILIVMTTSGNSMNLLRAVEAAKSQKLLTVSFLGKDGGKAHGMCDIELLIPTSFTARVQEAHKMLYHTLCEWIDLRVD